ncbi:piggyBac transposable element-derived protein 4 [Trichonephila clavata]|uniref:PiggyBac transposable element-derived protein 4 n=1 Tax=Trichonephila clavata TaxID=2740835 RepID=A0A8X6I1Q5_TRICU|nr:piggyBac transposable element-derived protein 4 [Trichonephila clavata]
MLPDKSSEFKAMKDFRRKVIRGLLLMGAKKTTRKRNLSSISVKKHKPHVLVDKRTENVEYIPVKTEGGLYRRCFICSTRKDVHRSRWLCQSYNVPLCLQAYGPTCFEKSHSTQLIKFVK